MLAKQTTQHSRIVFERCIAIFGIPEDTAQFFARTRSCAASVQTCLRISKFTTLHWPQPEHFQTCGHYGDCTAIADTLRSEWQTAGQYGNSILL